VQLPLAYSLARRLRERLREREELLQRALEASDVERRRIASDLHDGVVQDLAGIAYSLAGEARTGDVDPQTASRFEQSAAGVRASIKSLRSLLVEIYPPNLHEEGLESALTDLLAAAQARGLSTSLQVEALPEPLPQTVAALLYRTAQEALRNVLSHGNAQSVVIRVEGTGESAAVTVIDDGIGFVSDAGMPGVTTGHFGLVGLRALVADAGGTMEVRSAPGEGTTIRVEVPLP
jgi:signal transduction histidine kinase